MQADRFCLSVHVECAMERLESYQPRERENKSLSNEMKERTQHKSKIGGQALIEGIMMRGVRRSAMAVRAPDKTIQTEEWDNSQTGSTFKPLRKIPLLRGVYSMVSSMMLGYKCMMKSAEMAGLDLEEEGEPSKLELWLEKTFGDQLMKVITWIGAILGVVLAVVLFMFLPTFVVWGIGKVVPIGIFKGLLEGVIKIIVFILYLLLVGKMQEMRRVFEYHGAEHKTIACFEAGEELTVENIQKQTRFHPRCGTSFMILVLIISILVFSVVSWGNPLVRTIWKLVLLPVVIGIAFELIQLAGRHDNVLTRIISWPGIQLQHLTTREPHPDQIEVAIAAVTPVLPETLEEDRW